MIILKADQRLENVFRRLIQTMRANVEWNGFFLVLGSHLVLPGRVRSLYFNYDSRKVYTNIEELSIQEDRAEDTQGNDVLSNVLNMTLYAFGKWGSINGLRVDKDYGHLNRLFHNILKELRVEADYREENFRFYSDSLRITYEEVVEKAVQWGKTPAQAVDPEDGQAGTEDYQLGLWHRLVWKRETVEIKRRKSPAGEGRTDRLGHNFYRVDYLCPDCGERLHMVIYPVGKEFPVETEHGRVLLARACTCSGCNSFYTPVPRKLLAEGDEYAYHFEEDRKAYEDYLELLGRNGERCSNYKFNEYASGDGGAEDNTGRSGLREACMDAESMTLEELEDVEEKTQEGFYEEADVRKYGGRLSEILRGRLEKEGGGPGREQGRYRETLRPERAVGEPGFGRNGRAAGDGDERRGGTASETEAAGAVDKAREAVRGEQGPEPAAGDRQSAGGGNGRPHAERMRPAEREDGRKDVRKGMNGSAGAAGRTLGSGPEAAKTGDVAGAAGSGTAGFPTGGAGGVPESALTRSGSRETAPAVGAGGFPGDRSAGNKVSSAEKIPSDGGRNAPADDPVKAYEQARGRSSADGDDTLREGPDARSAEAARNAQDARSAEVARNAQDARGAEAARNAQDARSAEAARNAQDARSAEAARNAQDARGAEAARNAQDTSGAENTEGETLLARVRRILQSCRGKSFAEISRAAVEIRKEISVAGGEQGSAVSSALLELEECRRDRGQREAQALMSRLPEQLDRKKYTLFKDKLAEYRDVGTELWEKELEERRDSTERGEIREFVNRAPKRDRKDLLKLYENLKGQDFREHNAAPFLEKIHLKLEELDRRKIEEICPDMGSIGFEDAMELYEKIASGDFLPEIKTNTLEILDKRLTRMKTEENVQLVRKLERELEGRVKTRGRLHLYNVGKIQKGDVEEDEEELMERAVRSYGGPRGKYEYPLLIADTSFRENGKEGIVLTPDHIFWNSLLSGGASPVSGVERLADFGGLGNSLRLILKNGTVKKLPSPVPKEEKGSFMEALEDFIKYLQEKPESRKITYLARDSHEIKCCFRCGYKFREGNVCPKCGSKYNQ